MLNFITAFVFCAISNVQANVWDNLWSNNQNKRVVFPEQFELKLSWNATVKNQISNNNTNYIQGHIKIDQETNRMMVNANFSTLSLAPQELIGYILDFESKQIYIKQNKSCIYYDLVMKMGEDLANDKLKDEKIFDTSEKSWFNFEINELPNIQELFDLFPYFFYQRQLIEIDGKLLKEYCLSNPLGGQANMLNSGEIDILAYFEAETMELDRLVYRDNREPYKDNDNTYEFSDDDADSSSSDISDLINGVDNKSYNQSNKIDADGEEVPDHEPRHLFTLWAPQPITKMKFTPEDMQFQNIDCNLASELEQKKLDHYIRRIIELVTQKSLPKNLFGKSEEI